MIQFNLLPDIKIQYLKARRQKRLVMLTSTIIIIASLSAIVIMTVVVFGLQRKNINDLTSDINAATEQLQGTEDLTKMLTVQNQLGDLTTLHDDKPVASRLFTYINQATPSSVTISRLIADYDTNTMSISGAAPSLEPVNTFIDTLKFTTFTTQQNNQPKPAFSNVVLSNFGRDEDEASYTITLTFDPVIFSELEQVTLNVPQIITNRSQTEQPAALFEAETEQQ